MYKGEPHLDLDRLSEIRKVVSVPLVLHLSLIHISILSFKSDKSSNFDESSNLEKIKFDSIVYIKEPEFYTLQSISPIDAAQIRSFQISQTLSLTGKGILVGIIDTGIDYLSEDFMDEYGKTRLHCIWDQTIMSERCV